MGAKGGRWPRLQGLVLRASSALSVKMLSEITVGRFQRVHDLRSPTTTLEGDLAVSLVQVVHVVLLLAVEASLPPVGVLENLCEYPFSVRVGLASLEVDATTVDAVELVLDASGSPGRSLAASTSWVAPSLGHRGSRDFELCCWA